MAATHGRYLFVSDGDVGHACPMGPDDRAQEHLEDYASGYASLPGQIVVRWAVFQDGQEVTQGSWMFDVR
jgi:hypothetical protein